ncbi:MAG: hypothetical protein ABSF77_16240 [Spirochaetia bacterium]|jgi:predicted nucleic acid-binding protein
MRAAEIVCTAFVTLAKLRAGFLAGKAGRPNEQTAHHYARLFLQLRKQGTPIPTNDIWIAALDVQHDLVLFSRDAHFERLQQLPRA